MYQKDKDGGAPMRNDKRTVWASVLAILSVTAMVGVLYLPLALR
jgi:hypothetical protein